MGRAPCCSKTGLNKGAWTSQEDEVLCKYIRCHGVGDWRNLPLNAGLKRCGKSCRLRWMNYLRPNIKRGNFSEEEEDLIIRLHNLLGNRWSLIARRIPGRTDNEIKNYWNTHLHKKLVPKQEDSAVSSECRSCQKTVEIATISTPISERPQRNALTADTMKVDARIFSQEKLLNSERLGEEDEDTMKEDDVVRLHGMSSFSEDEKECEDLMRELLLETPDPEFLWVQ